MNGSQLLEAYSRLKSLRQNVPENDVHEKFVAEYHQILALLEQASGANLENFRLPAGEIRRVVVSGNFLTGEKHYSQDLYCDHNFFVMKVDAVLMMFEVMLTVGPGSKSPIGFKPPKR